MADRFDRGNPNNIRDSGGFHRGTKNNTGDATNNAGITPSKLLRNTNSLRNELISRNLYTPNRLYPITEKNQLQNVLNSVNGIISLIAPFKSYNLNNTWYARLVTTQTPLSEIGLAMLGKQFAMNFGSHAAQKNFPKIKIANLFDGNKNTHLFTKNINFSITKKTAKTNFQEFINNAISYYPARDNPFKPSSTNASYIENSGTGQLTFLYQSLNQNIYKQGFNDNINFFGIKQSNDKILNDYSDKKHADTQLTRRSAIIGNKDSVGTVNLTVTKYAFYYDFFNTNPYSTIRVNTSIIPNQDSITQANSDAIISQNTPNPTYVNTTEEYAPTADFIKFNFGTTNTNGDGEILNNIANENSWINESDEFGDTLANKIVWGRNGANELATARIAQLRGTTQNEKKEKEDSLRTDNLQKFNEKFNVYSGLLEYTRNLLNASQGAVVDITRKAFKSGDKLVGFQGSGLFVANDSDYTNYPGNQIAGIKGVRQHTVIDQYDRFAKAIRFNGNKVYNASGGNKDSVIYNSVIPRIHPTTPVNDGVPNNKNLMFTIENLAVRVISAEGVGIIDDEYGSMIPISEVGPFNGRQMWFPPYNMEINESTASNFDKIVMVGRNEPMYSYMHSERSATLSFTLLVDYPQNLKNLFYQGAGKHRIISEFFAFGGDAYTPEVEINNAPLKVAQNNAQIEIITGPGGAPPVDTPDSALIRMVFPNDMPEVGQINNIIDTMYININYEIEKSLVNNSGVVSNGNTNLAVYYKTEIIGDPKVSATNPNHFRLGPLPAGFSQYTQSGMTNTLNKALFDIFSVENNNKYFEVRIFGHTTTLNDIITNYNLNLGQRRADAAKHLVEERLKAIFGKSLEELGVKIITESLASKGSDPANSEGKTKAEIDAKLENPKAIQERFATIQVVRTRFPPLKKIKPITVEELKVVNQLKADNGAITKTFSKQNSNNVSQCTMEERKGPSDNGSGDGGILGGFKSVEGNYYYPAFHSQTPEDFHKRLTFLQQCMRQGAAKRYDAVDENGILRARNSVFGRQPICILRIGDFFHTKIIIENLTIDYTDTTWDMNPEGFGMQPMIAKVTLQMKVLGGQSLKGPIDALQNAVSFNYYANSSFTKDGLYARPSDEADKQDLYMNGVDGKTGLLGNERSALNKAYNKKVAKEKFEAIQQAAKLLGRV